MDNKINLGFYINAATVGGTERLVRDLAHKINRRNFNVSLFYKAWLELEEFFDFKNCPPLNVINAPVVEIGGHVKSCQKSAAEPDNTNKSKRRAVELAKTAWRLYKKYIPFRICIIETVFFIYNLLFFIPNIVILVKAFGSKGIQVLHIVNGGYPGSIHARQAVIASKIAGIPHCVMTVCSLPAEIKSPAQYLESLLDRFVYKYCDIFVVPADFIARQLVERRKFGGAKFRKIPWGVPAPQTNYSDADKEKLFQMRNIFQNVKIIGTIANFLPVKGYEYLIEAVKILEERSETKDFHVLLVGDGPTKTTIQDKVKRMNLEKHVTFAGYSKNIYAFLELMDIFVCPSIWEGLPYTILEAMSMRKTIVASSVGGIPVSIINGKSGMLVPPKQPAALAEAIGVLLRESELSQNLGAAAYEYYLKNNAIEAMLKNNEALYKSFFTYQI